MTVKLTIDGRDVEVAEGTSVLDAARRLGIELPTLCHRDGIQPAGSCFLCVVQVNGRDNLVPSCVCPAEEGMTVTTDSDEIRDARRTALELLLSDHRGDCEAPCTLACPAGLDIPEFIRYVRDGRPGEALNIIRERIPLPGVLGRVCPRYCERVCWRRELDEPIAICALKRYPADVDARGGEPRVPECGPSTGRRVGIVGAGVAGLSAAFYLLRDGHECTIYDGADEPGGVLRYGVPRFRLPVEAIEADVEPIRWMGAEFRMGMRLGEDVTLDELREQHDAVLLAIGAHETEPPAVQAEGAVSALDFLRSVSGGQRPQVGERVVVLGHEEAAVAAARTALRLGAGRVTLLSARGERRTGGTAGRLDEARAEGVRLEPEVVSREVRRAGGGFTVTCSRDGEEFSIGADTLIMAPARRVCTEHAERAGLTVARGRIEVDRDTMRTGLEDVFAAGEAALGTTSAVRALASGRTAAVAISQYLQGREVPGADRVNSKMGRLSLEEQIELFRGIPESERVQVRVLSPQERKGSFEEVEKGLSDEQVVHEANRCLECDCIAKGDCRLRDYATEYGARAGTYRGECRRPKVDDTHPSVVYDSGKCILCGLCVRISEGGDAEGLTFVRRGFQARTRVPFGMSLRQGLPSPLAEDCAEACPTGALAVRRRPPEGPEE